MKRLLARAGVLAVLAGVPMLLYALGAPPRVPSFDLPDGLSSTYLPLDPVLQVIALLAWAVWAYLAVATLLRAAALWADSRSLPGRHSLAVASSLLIPSPLRGLLDVAIGGAILASTLVPRGQPAAPVSRPAAAVVRAERNGDEPAIVRTQSYRVRPGDSLWKIAERELGSGFRWREIFERNRGHRFADGHRLQSPRLIHPGWILELPGSSRGHKEGTPADATQARRLRTTPSPKHEERPPQVEAPKPDDDEAHTRPAVDPVVRLPSGAIVAASFASGLLTAELLGRLRRRRSRRPLAELPTATEIPEPGIVRELRHAGVTPTASPLDVALEHTSTVWREACGTWPRLLFAYEDRNSIRLYLEEDPGALPAESGGGVSPRIRFEEWHGRVRAEIGRPFPPRLRRLSTPLEQGLTVPLGADRKGRALHAALLGTRGASIQGDRAKELVETAILSLAASASPEDLRVITLGTELECQLPNVESTTSWDRASAMLRDIEVELLRRARILADEEVDDIWAHLASHPDERFPALVMIVAEPAPALRGVVEGIGRQAARLGGVLIAAGWRAEGPTLRVSADDQIEIDFEGPAPVEGGLTPFIVDEQMRAEAASILRQATRDDETSESYAAAVAEDVPTPIVPREVKPAVSLDLAPASPPVPPHDVPAIHCLGPLRITRGDELLGDGWRKKALELAAYLAVHAEGAAKDRIMEDLWPGLEAAKQTRIFEVCTSAIRSHVRTENERRFVEKIGESFRLEPEAWWIDATEFMGLVEEGMTASDIGLAVQRLRSSIALYRGDFCDDTYYSWAEPVRERCRNLFVRACAKLGELLLEAGQSEEALSVLERATAADPLCEDIWRRAMLVEVALGRSAAALDRYRRLTAALASELQVDPDPETQQLAARISITQKRRGSSALVSS